ncbi:response regulator [Paenibacillus sp. IB182496]|uniref:Circadian input-output histidine kinase CikA n=1 Tax=Paenibacillus sabuli TaxID=2772509 RepID=A0A927GT57_9BACL|nr:ATP-binding protein [Paenibacillus sabuli]MBD2846377.1 response regulator [Paenibacillus sabuli]
MNLTRATGAGLSRQSFMAAVLLACVLAAGLYLYQAQGAAARPAGQPAAVAGELDLSQWDFASSGTVQLQGEWEFYWERLDDGSGLQRGEGGQWVDIPHVWTDAKRDGANLPGAGYATYRLRIQLPPGMERLALHIPTLSTSCRVFVDQQEVARCGVVSDERSSATAAYRPQLVQFEPQGETMELVVQIANYMYDRGGMWYALDLGLPDAIQRQRENALATDLVLLGIFFFMGLYHVCLYMLRPFTRVTLFFATGCLIGALRLSVMDEVVLLNWFPSMPLRGIVMLEYLTYYGGVAAITHYLHELYPDEVRRRVTRMVSMASAAFMLTVLFTPVSFFTSLVGYSHLALLPLLVYLVYGVYRAMCRRRNGASLQFWGIFFFFLTILHDMMFNMYYIFDWFYKLRTIQVFQGQIMVFGLFVLVFVQAIVLARRFSNSFKEVEQMSEKLIALNRMKDEFLFNTSHELKTPLHGMINLSEALRDGAAGRLNTEQRDHLSSIISVSRRLSNLINDILDFYKLKHGEIRLERRSVSLQAVLRANHAVFSHFIADRPIRLVMRVPDDLPKVLVDENRLLQIFYNLVGNAIKFTERGEVAVSAMQREGEIVVSVSDTGIGIPADKQEQIFQSFEHIGASVAKEYGGTGLGLSITKRLVELSGGTLTVSSAPGQGSTFQFTLPVSEQAASEPASVAAEPALLTYIETPRPGIVQPQEASAAQAEAYTILAVDDDPTNLQVIVQIFAQEPYHVLLASSGTEALEMIESRTDIDLVLLDVMMPGPSGYEVCRMVRERFTLFELPVLLVTVKNEPEDLLQGFDAGANDFVVKPFYSHELRGRVRTLLELKRSVEETLRSEMAFLQAQIKPHFLFNALNTIVSICPREPRLAAELLTELGDFLRGSFDFENKARQVTLEKELQLTESYLMIEQARFGERLRVEVEVEDGLACMLPPLTIQPLVENAVRHGIMSREQGGTVRLQARSAEEGGIRVCVEDDGVGIRADKLKALSELEGDGGRTPAVGVGLRNVSTRLRRMYGHGLNIHSKPGQGTRISFLIPE